MCEESTGRKPKLLMNTVRPGFSTTFYVWVDPGPQDKHNDAHNCRESG